MGKVGIVLGLRGKTSPPLRYQPGAHLLRAYARERGGRILGRGTARRGRHGGGEEQEVARRLLGDLAYRSRELEEELAEVGIALVTSEASARRPRVRQQVEICFSSLKRVFGVGETLAKTLVELVTRIAAKMTAYTYAFIVKRVLGRPQGRIEELWA